MKQLRSVGAFMIVCSILCFVVAYDRYQTNLVTAKALMNLDGFDGVEFDSVSVPMETYIAGFAGVVLLVGGFRCFLTWRSIQKQSEGNSNAMLDA
jgi:hypothetical protein